MNFCLDRLREGQWVHLYPEGRINMDKVDMRYKWGIARLIDECEKVPIVIPIYHLGMDSILPNRKPYIPWVGQKVTICIGEPIDLTADIKEVRDRNVSHEEFRIEITRLLQAKMKKLQKETEIWHAKR